ncbi:S1 domain-containing RNA-binding protein [Levilactobacillus bambusae]|uniref:RNA-binding protein S1 n=1 Tax=Levilactobacillus bambusae TaxID=2024736 RepID=A0A2V1MW16_9LACO|nr:S1 domain-containing RNA-binding protein [Levilactobacillus bambusae]PWF99296.1 RNA-binding protein S1 [Levilactobacillus bambusae]
MAIEVGAKVSGKVTGITNFGAFVDLGDHKTGLVHISQISDQYIKDIHDVLSVGDTVTVKVLTIGDDGKIGLTMREDSDKPAHSEHKPSHYHSDHNEGGHSSNGHSNYHHSGDRDSHQGASNHRDNHHSTNNHSNGGSRGHFSNSRSSNHKESFDDLMSGFLKDSESRLSTLKKNTEGKRGGRGGRRS